ncbi:hypothetical protein ACFOPQ_06235 [Deinococcus antarcticus]|uniref:Glycerophosphoryl diester phosphodiesterase family protein n=1 Tax=Deinococcus antarcticus TaxID=1298767 RepID=A0ABV8A3T8_9DEIO
MIKPPTLPASYVDSPVTPHEAQQARAGVEVNGNRIQAGVTALLVLSVVSSVLSLLGMWWLERSLPDLLLSWGLPLTPAEQQEFRETLREIPGWFWLVTGLLTLLATVINVWCLNVVRRAVAGVQRWTLEPSPDNAAELVRQARTVRPWITLGQWFPVITGVLMTLLYIVLFTVAGLGTGTDTAETTLPVVFSVLGSLLGMLPGAVIAWLGLGAVKRWLDAVVTRTGNVTFPVRPFARNLDGWLVFALVLLVLGLLYLLAVSALLVFFPAFFNWMLENDSTTTPPDAETMRLIGSFVRNVAWLALAGVLLYGLVAFLVYWSRNFANSVARLLDASRPGPLHPAQQDLTPSVPGNW